MAPDNFILEQFAQEENLEGLDDIVAEIKEVLTIAVKECQQDGKPFDVRDIKIYEQGSFLNHVNVGQNAKLELVVELSKAGGEDFLQFKLENLKQTSRRAIKVKPKYSLLKFKNDLCYKLEQLLENAQISRTKTAINIFGNEEFDLTVEILPAFSFAKKNKAGENVPCVLVFDEVDENYIVAYPHLHTQNLNRKDNETTGNYRKFIRIFKNLRDNLAENGFSTRVPGYFIDCLLYNAPASLFCGKNLDEVLLKLLNFFNIKNFNEMVCVHEQFKMFGNNFDQWDIKSARNFVTQLIIMHNV